MKIPVEVSARHVHLSQESMDILFGKGYALTPARELSQPGQFACEERVCIKGPRGKFESVAVLGPVRKKTQVELSVTDCIKIGIPAVIRESGHTERTPGCVIKGPAGEQELREGVIAAKRHVHMTPQDAQKLGVCDGEIRRVKINTSGRSLIYDDVVMRSNQNFKLSMHLDTDEANAANWAIGTVGEIIL